MIRISVQHISKKFTIGFEKRQTLLRRTADIFKIREGKKEITVLHDVNLEIPGGQSLGIIGSNGSGKSTLLRIIAGIYREDSGIVENNGKVVSVINLGIGLKHRLTMRENIYLVSSLFGMSQADTKNKFQSIVEFSELHGFVETKIYQFSAGMIQRLAFSIAIHADPDILLLDEVFEVGDQDFKQKSANKIRELIRSGACVILVTHDLESIMRHCDRVMWMQKGSILKIGEPAEIIREYTKIKHELR